MATKPQRVVILGSTGSIGVNTLDVIGLLPDRFRVVGLAAYQSIDRLCEQAMTHRPSCVGVVDEASADALRGRLRAAGSNTVVFGGAQSLEQVCLAEPFDVLVVATGGTLSLGPTLAVADRVRRIAIANKELLVMAGEQLMHRVRRAGTELLPIDSEHSAIFQCLDGQRRHVRRIYLTSSGGPLRTVPKSRFADITPEEAVNHPKWKMGRKISVDSATMMNKGLEIVEARWLFDLPVEQIQVLVHPEAIVHSMVEFVDGALLAQLGVPDMRIPIQYALTYPERLPCPANPLDWAQLSGLTFEAPDLEKFECLQLAYEAARQGGTAPCAMNAANEVAVAAFLDHRLRLSDIPRVIGTAMARHHRVTGATLEQVLEVDRTVREDAEQLVAELSNAAAA